MHWPGIRCTRTTRWSRRTSSPWSPTVRRSTSRCDESSDDGTGVDLVVGSAIVADERLTRRRVEFADEFGRALAVAGFRCRRDLRHGCGDIVDLERHLPDGDVAEQLRAQAFGGGQQHGVVGRLLEFGEEVAEGRAEAGKVARFRQLLRGPAVLLE